jgi:hypothetical protein
MHEKCFLSNQRAKDVGHKDTKALRFFWSVVGTAEKVDNAAPFVIMSEIKQNGLKL